MNAETRMALMCFRRPRLLCLMIAGLLFYRISAFCEWINVTGNLAGMPSECGNLCPLSVFPGEDKIIAGVAKQGLWQTSDGGTNWTPLGQIAGSDAIVNRPSRIEYDPRNANIFWESGIYNSSGVYQTTNAGGSFRHLGNARHNDSVPK